LLHCSNILVLPTYDIHESLVSFNILEISYLQKLISRLQSKYNSLKDILI
jgi:hypothetical protein